MKKVLNILIPVLVLLLFLFVTFYFALPTITLKYASGIAFIGFMVVVLGVFIFSVTSSLDIGYLFRVMNSYEVVNNTFQKKAGAYVQSNNEFNSKMVKPTIGIMALGFIVILLSGILSGISQPLFRANDYYDLIEDRVIEEEDTNYINLQNIDLTNVTSLTNIDSSLAEKKATTLFGEKKGFGTEYYLGTFTDQIVNGKFVTVAPIEYNGFFKYNANKNEGTPGYVIVEKQNFTNDAGSQIITDLNLKYMSSSYFSTDLNRHLYFNGYATSKLRISGFELDDELNPYWIINVYKNSIGFSGQLVDAVLTVDPETGEIQEYSLDNVPTWIDNIQDSDVVVNKLNDHGMYNDGFMNSLFGQKGVTQTTHGSRHVMLNGQLYLFTGITSLGADEAISQIVLVNKRNLETIFYDISGATEYVAMQSAEGKLQNYGYDATFPIPIVINGIPSYFIPLKDTSGLIKHYAFVRISNHTVVGAANSVEEALLNYQSLLTDGDDLNVEEVTGTLQTINYYGDTFYLEIDGKKYIMKNVSSDSSDIYYAKIGDRVKIKVTNNVISSFERVTTGE